MFCFYGNYNNPFVMNNWFMPGYSFNNFMPSMFNMAFVNPVFPLFFAMNLYSSPRITLPGLYSYQNNSSIFASRKTAATNQRQSISRQETPAVETKKESAKQTSIPKKSTVTQSINTTQTGNSKKKISPSHVKKDLGQVFLDRVKQIAKNLNCNYKDLLAVMNAESGLNSKAVNKKSGATGLIQFMPSTAKELGTTTDELKNMSPVEQLEYVEKYLVKTKKAAGFETNYKLSSGDLYALIFLPGRAKRETLTDSSEKYYTYNKGLDINKDGYITNAELAQRVANFRVNESIFA